MDVRIANLAVEAFVSFIRQAQSSGASLNDCVRAIAGAAGHVIAINCEPHEREAALAYAATQMRDAMQDTLTHDHAGTRQ